MDRIALYGMAIMTGKNPERLSVFKLDTLLRRLEGKYSAHKGTVLADVKRNGSFVMLSGEHIGENIVLIPETENAKNAKKATFYTLSGTAKMIVEFKFNMDGIEMIYERYKYKKTKRESYEARKR